MVEVLNAYAYADAASVSPALHIKERNLHKYFL
jgi:hypothetical protein